MRINYWNLVPGGKTGQEGKEQKLAEGLDFVERLKADGEIIESVDQEENRLVIKIKDAWEI